MLIERGVFGIDSRRHGGSLKRVLLTGGMGYVGSHICVALAASGCEVVLYDNLLNSELSVLNRLEFITGSKPSFVCGDVRDRVLLEMTLKDYHIDAVIHCAGLKAVGESVQRPLDYYDSNLRGGLSLVQAMQNVGVKTLVFSSSAAVYGDPKYLPLDEEHPTVPTNPYGRTKLFIEEVLADTAKSDPGWRIVCLRYFNPVGAHESGLIGDDPTGTPNNLMPYIARVVAGSLPMVYIYGDDYETRDGSAIRDYFHVMDLADGHLAALQFLERELGWHAFNLGAGGGVSVLEMVRAFEGVCGKYIPHQIVARRPGDVSQCFADPSKALMQLGWQVMRGLDEICRSAWVFQQRLASSSAKPVISS